MHNPPSMFITADPPRLPTGGGTRIYHFVKAISGVTDCKLFVLFPVQNEELPTNILKSCSSVQCSQIAFPGKSKGSVNRIIDDLRLLFAPWSINKNHLIVIADYFVTHPYNGKNILRKAFRFLLKHSLCWYVIFLYRTGCALPAKTLERLNQFKELEPSILKAIETSEILWIELSGLLPFFQKEKYPSMKMVCNAHNIEYKLLERLQHLSRNKLERNWYKCQAAAMKKAELKGFSECDLIITCSEADRNYILDDLPTAHIKVIPNGVDIDYFIPNKLLTPQPSLLFTGTMGYEPNKDAVNYFIESIFPYVRETNPSCTFIVAGANAAHVFKKHLGSKNIEIITSPIDMRPFYNKAWIVVVPLRSGSGTRLKILEAMAMENPVVSTAIGAEGIKVKNGIQLFISDDEKEFAEKINLLIQDKNIATCITKAAKETIFDLYSWGKIEEITTETILQLNKKYCKEKIT